MGIGIWSLLLRKIGLKDMAKNECFLPQGEDRVPGVFPQENLSL